MSLALTIAIQRHRSMDAWFLAYDRITVDGCRDFFESIKELKPRPFPDDISFDWYGDEGVERKHFDSYGEKLTYLTVGELATFFLDETNSGTTERNLALGKYLKALPGHYWLVLWWH